MNKFLKNKKIIVFDGVCLLCNKYVEFVAKYDNNDVFRFVSLQNKNILTKYIAKNSLINNTDSILLIKKSNSISTKSSAIIYIASELKFPFNLFVCIKIIPKKLRDFIYDLIAKNRRNLFGEIDHCSILNQSKIKNIEHKIID